MLRTKLVEKRIGIEPGFHWRGQEITRFEGLSDAVFGFAVTLLIVSLEVPRTFSELLETMRGFFAFAICFVLLMLIWYQQYIFFRRYGLQDTVTIVLNSALLFVVLILHLPTEVSVLDADERMVGLVTGSPSCRRNCAGSHRAISTAYSDDHLQRGISGDCVVFVLLFLHAYRQRAQLALSPVEVFDTRGWSICDTLLAAA